MRRWCVLERFIKDNGWTSGAEIGVWKGQTFFYLLDHCPKLKLIGVDNWTHYSTYPEKKDKYLGVGEYWPIEETEAIGRSVMSKASHYENATTLYMDSGEAASRVERSSLDFVFIDADHTTEGVMTDIHLWTPKVKAGGMVIGHDRDWPSVQRALKAVYEDWGSEADNIWYVRKK